MWEEVLELAWCDTGLRAIGELGGWTGSPSLLSSRGPGLVILGPHVGPGSAKQVNSSPVHVSCPLPRCSSLLGLTRVLSRAPGSLKVKVNDQSPKLQTSAEEA